MWEYLESTGVLERGGDIEIKEAKKAYRKQYLLKYKQTQRKNKPEFTINFSKDNGEFSKVANEAKKHNQTITSFIYSATLAYINQTYIVPNTLQIAKLEQLLSDCLNEVQSICKVKERFHWERERKLETIEKRIEKMEIEFNEIFRNPPLSSNDS
jgi:hypothetical protein